jgi:DNA-binding NarL/FixJ family response regulator
MFESGEHNVAGPAEPKWIVRDRTDENLIRLVVLDEHGLFRASLAKLLASQSGFEVVGESGTWAEALEILNGFPADIVLMDFDLGTEHADDLISAARKAGYQGRFLIVAGTTDAERSAKALKSGASGIFLKSEAPERLVQAIRLIASGAVWVDQRIVQLLADGCLSPPRPADQKSVNALEEREQKVLLGILAGLTNRKIADDIGVSESSIKHALQGLFSRAGVRTRGQLVRLALEGSLGNVRQLANEKGATGCHAAAPPAASKQSLG